MEFMFYFFDFLLIRIGISILFCKLVSTPNSSCANPEWVATFEIRDISFWILECVIIFAPIDTFCIHYMHVIPRILRHINPFLIFVFV